MVTVVIVTVVTVVVIIADGCVLTVVLDDVLVVVVAVDAGVVALPSPLFSSRTSMGSTVPAMAVGGTVAIRWFPIFGGIAATIIHRSSLLSSIGLRGIYCPNLPIYDIHT